MGISFHLWCTEELRTESPSISLIMRQPTQVWKHPLRDLLLLTCLIFLLPSSRLAAQTCGSLSRMADKINRNGSQPNLFAAFPGMFDPCVPNYGWLTKTYFVPGSRNCRYRITFPIAVYYGNLFFQNCYDDDLAYFAVHRFLTGGGTLAVYPPEQFVGPYVIEEDPVCHSGWLYVNRTVDVQGQDIVEIDYYSSACVAENGPGIGCNNPSITALTPGPASDISYNLPALPQYEEPQDYVQARVTSPNNFFYRSWEFTVLNGCTMDQFNDTTYVNVYADSGPVLGSSFHLKCKEDLTFPAPQPIDLAYGVGINYVTRSLPVVATPDLAYSGKPYAGGIPGHHHQLHLAVTDPGPLFDSVNWSFAGDPKDCTLSADPNDPRGRTLTIGNMTGQIFLRAENPTTGYFKVRYLVIQPQPEIVLFKALGVGREVQAGVTDPGAFGPNIIWFIDNRSPVDMDCSVEASGIVHAGTKLGTFNLHLRDIDNGYEIVGNFTVLPAPTFALYTWDSQFSYPRSLIAGHNEWIPLRQISGATMNLPVAVFENNPVGCQIRVEHYLPAELNSGAVGANGGLITLHIEADDTYWVEQDFVVRRVPTLTYNDLNPIRAWGSVYSPTVTYNRGARKRTETETLPDNTQRTSAYIDKRLDSVTVMDASATPVQLGRTAYQYYTSGTFCGFLANMIDARNGTTSYTYNAADQIETITTPAPGFGQTTPQLTRFAYDETNPQGRIETVTLPDLTTVTRTYRLTGELKRISGSGVTPAEYDYEQGRVKSVKTWRAFPDDATAQTTLMNYSADRGFLQSKTLAGAPGPSFTYYDSGRVKTRIWSGGATTTYNYNNAGEQWQVDYSDTLTNPDVTYTYNTRGQTQSVVDPTGTHTTEYYTHGLVHTETHTGGVLADVVVEHSYDAKLRPQTTIVRKGGSEIYRQGYEYNPGDSYVRNITFDGVLAHYDYENNAPLVSGITLKQGTEAGAIILTGSRQHNYLDQLVQAT